MGIRPPVRQRARIALDFRKHLLEQRASVAVIKPLDTAHRPCTSRIGEELREQHVSRLRSSQRGADSSRTCAADQHLLRADGIRCPRRIKAEPVRDLHDMLRFRRFHENLIRQDIGHLQMQEALISCQPFGCMKRASPQRSARLLQRRILRKGVRHSQVGVVLCNRPALQHFVIRKREHILRQRNAAVFQREARFSACRNEHRPLCQPRGSNMIEGRIQQEVAPFPVKATLAGQHHAADAPLLPEQSRSPGHEANTRSASFLILPGRKGGSTQSPAAASLSPSHA